MGNCIGTKPLVKKPSNKTSKDVEGNASTNTSIKSKLSEEQVRVAVDKIFDAYDTDHNGSLDKY